MPEHRAQRRDAGAARDEDETAFFGGCWKGEVSDRSLDVDRRAGVERQMVARGSVGFDADQQLEQAIAPRILRRRCDPLRLSCRVSVLRDEHGLTRVVVEGATVQIEAHDACPRRGDLHVWMGRVRTTAR